MMTKQVYQPRVGDKVRVLVEKDGFGDSIDTSVPHYVMDSMGASTALIMREFSERVPNASLGRPVDRWRVEFTDLKPWRDPAPQQLPQGHVLLRDPSIGEVEREYREVRREAKVGELVKLVEVTHAFNESHSGKFADGSVYPITHKDGVWVGLAEEGAWMRHDYSQYLVLEPTDIVWIYEGDDVYTRYQLAEAGRVAQVDEKVLVVNPKWAHDYDKGDVVAVAKQLGNGAIEFIDKVDESNSLLLMEYRVLLPLTVESEIAATNHAAIVDDNHDFTALLALASGNMARHLEQARTIGSSEGWREAEETFKPTIAELERQLSIANGQLAKEIEFNAPIRQIAAASGLSASQVAQHLAEIQRAYAHARDAIVYGTTTPNKTLTPQKEAKPTRDEVVEMAKGEVDSIVNSVAEDGEEITFRVNREFRTVVAELRIQGEATRSAKAHATCAPDEAFNVHIGKVIAACRLVGSAVPAVYLNAPQPEKAQVGDVVFADKEARLVTRGDANPWGTPPTCAVDSFYANAGKLIDDSRDGYVYDVTRWRSSQQKYRTAQTKGGAAA